MRNKAFLVYQAGIANVFQVDCFNLAPFGREARRVFQGDFRGAVNFCHGLGVAGWAVKTAACKEAGDISDEVWSENLHYQPFSDQLVVLNLNTVGAVEK